MVNHNGLLLVTHFRWVVNGLIALCIAKKVSKETKTNIIQNISKYIFVYIGISQKFIQLLYVLYHKISTKYGMYEPNCGITNLMMSWGHDEYMYNVLRHNQSTLPDQALYIIRYHSFYPWHVGGDYQQFTKPGDEEIMKWVNIFK